MSKPKFKIGDIVRVRTTLDAAWAHDAMSEYVPTPGTVGTVEEVDSLGGWIRWTGEHGCHADRTWVPFEYVEQFSEQVVIYRRGRSVFAKDLTTHRIAEAKCNPEDEFDFLRGAALALDRLLDREEPKPEEPKPEEPKPEEPKPEEPKYFTGDVVCVYSDFGWWTVGRVYPVENGIIVDDTGDPRIDVLSIEQLNRRLSDDDAEVKFVPFRGVAPREFK